MEKYPKKMEKHMIQLYNSFPEDKKRIYAGLQSLGLGPGGEEYIADLFNCDIESIKKGKEELKKL